MKPPHDFDGLQAKGKWLVAEMTGSIASTHGGLAVPEQAQVPIWVVLSVGEDIRNLKEGERIMFKRSVDMIEHDGRRVAFMLEDDVILTLVKREPSRIIGTNGGRTVALVQ